MMDLLLAIVLIVLAFLGGALGGMYLVRKQIEKNLLTTHVWMLKRFVLFWVQMVKKNQVSEGTTSLPPNHPPTKGALLTIKRKNK